MLRIFDSLIFKTKFVQKIKHYEQNFKRTKKTSIVR